MNDQRTRLCSCSTLVRWRVRHMRGAMRGVAATPTRPHHHGVREQEAQHVAHQDAGRDIQHKNEDEGKEIALHNGLHLETRHNNHLPHTHTSPPPPPPAQARKRGDDGGPWRHHHHQRAAWYGQAHAKTVRGVSQVLRVGWGQRPFQVRGQLAQTARRGSRTMTGGAAGG